MTLTEKAGEGSSKCLSLEARSKEISGNQRENLLLVCPVSFPSLSDRAQLFCGELLRFALHLLLWAKGHRPGHSLSDMTGSEMG